jgi:hypothetical protein
MQPCVLQVSCKQVSCKSVAVNSHLFDLSDGKAYCCKLCRQGLCGLQLTRQGGAKTPQASACTDIACAFMKWLLPSRAWITGSAPSKDMYICDVCNCTYHWQCLLRTNCYNVHEQEAIDTNDTWACPACANLKRKWKKRKDLYISPKRAGKSFFEH